MKRAIGRQVSCICFCCFRLLRGSRRLILPPIRSLLQTRSPQEKFDYYVEHTFATGDVLERSALAGIAQTSRVGARGVGRIYGRRLGSNFSQYSIKKTPVWYWSST